MTQGKLRQGKVAYQNLGGLSEILHTELYPQESLSNIKDRDNNKPCKKSNREETKVIQWAEDNF